MDYSILILIAVFFASLYFNVPIAVAIALSTLSAMLLSIDFIPAVTTMAQRMVAGLNSFSLLAIPLFIFSGMLMGQGGIALRLIRFAEAIFGRVPGGLAFVNIVSCMLFGSISGSAVAATSAIGGFMVPAMTKAGYDKSFATAVTVSASTTGLLIPPSNILIIYSLASGGVSIAALFVAGYLPGIMVGLALMLVSAIYAKIRNYPVGESVSLREFCSRSFSALPSILLIVVVIGGILSGVFTATEAGVVAVVYSLLLSVLFYRALSWADLFELTVKTSQTTAVVMFLIACSSAMSWYISYENIPQLISNGLLALSDNPILILLIINIILLLVGIFMDITPAVLIFTPMFLPVVTQFGISPLHFGIIMILNLTIGLCTPPVGSVLFVGCSVAKLKIQQLIKPMLPLYLAMIVVLMLVTYIPWLSEGMPRLLGLIK